ncbi:titin homolog isoform X2 [Selaginella moellendorffii]|uniref:titin homolog isoform X2 n=1 Tax=Selaginella moellendorffii TaxID=88036 RepID=UPI000D1C740C|nr:titin homolog isoform X2 [Selaginella moellendorffii]|eukprot:XP_024534002.1 titin homolog isoform X2 [Selaginella moellendorffii]
MAMAQLRLESGAALAGGLPQCSLLAAPGVRCASERLLDCEQGLRIHNPVGRKFLSRSVSRKRVWIPVVQATSTARDDDDTKTGTKKLFKLPGTLKLRKKDTTVVFVAGATGNVGSRTVKELVKSGLRVRAGVRSIDKAESILGETISSITASSPLDRVLAFFGLRKDDQLEIIDCDLEKPDEIESALGNSGVVICAIGASEKEVLDVTGPYRIDYEATKNLIAAAKNAEVKHFILVTSLGTTKFGLPASVLNLFWGVLIWKAKAEKALIDSGLAYTIVRPGGMERPTDAFKETHNLRLAPKDTFTGGQVSRLQVAELLACIANNLELAEDKILEAIAETSAPLRSLEDLLIEIPSQSEKDEPDRKSTPARAAVKGKDEEALTKAEEKRESEQLKQKEAQNEAKRKAAEAKRAQDEAKRKAVEAKKTQELRQKISKELSALKQQEMAADAEAKSLQRKRIELSEKAQEAQEAAAKAEAVAKALLAAAKEGKTLSEVEKRKILEAEAKKVSQPPEIITKTAVPKASKKVASLKETAKSKVTDKVLEASVKNEPKEETIPPSKKSTETTQAGAKGVATADQLQTKKPQKPVPTKTSQDLAAEELPGKPATKSEQLQSKPEIPTEEVEQTVKKVENAKPEPANETQAKVLPTEKEDTTESEPARQPFRWFWQPKETAKSYEAKAKAEAEAEAPSTEATLSPYPRYPDLKPPSSPTPEPPSESEAPSEVPNQARSEAPQATKENAEMTTREREEASLLKAKSNLAFRWPWQDENITETPTSDVQGESEASASDILSSASQKEAVETVNDAARKDQSSVIQEEKQEEPSEDSIATDDDSPSVIPKEAEDAIEAAATTASRDSRAPETSSPEKEIVLEDKGKLDSEAVQFDPQRVKERELDSLAKAKAATAFVWPWKVASAGEKKGEKKVEKDEPKKKVVEAIQVDTPPIISSRPLSPYPSYPDWKPPTSPTPQPPKTVQKAAEEPGPLEKIAEKPLGKIEEKLATEADDNEQPDFSVATVKEREEAALAKARAALSWRWNASTEDVKINSGSSQSSLELKATPSPTPIVSLSRPLSPYARYEDLKPPASPMPRPPRVEAVKEVPKKHKLQVLVLVTLLLVTWWMKQLKKQSLEL